MQILKRDTFVKFTKGKLKRGIKKKGENVQRISIIFLIQSLVFSPQKAFVTLARKFLYKKAEEKKS